MSSFNTVVQNGTFTQDSVNRGSDKRRWVMQKEEKKCVFWIEMVDVLTLRIAKQVDDAAPVYSNSITTTSGNNWKTPGYLCIDKNGENIYHIVEGVNSWATLTRLDASTMGITSSISINTDDKNPLKIQISPDGEHLLFLCEGSRFYKTNLEGTSTPHIIIPSANDHPTSFVVSPRGLCATVRTGEIRIIKISDLTVSSYDTNISAVSSDVSRVGGFYLEGSFYLHYEFIETQYTSGVNYLIRIPDDDPGSNYAVKVTDVIPGNDVKKFNLAYDGSEYYGILCENNGADRKIMWKVDLDTLTLTPLRTIAKVQSGDQIIMETEFSDNTDYPIATIDTDGSNDDWTGMNRVQVFS